MHKNIARNTLIAAALAVAGTASAQAAEFHCAARIGPASAPQNSGKLLGTISADSQVAAEAKYGAHVTFTSLPVRTGRWVVHSVTCQPVK